MKNIFTLIALFFCLSIIAQETTDTMYVYRGNNTVERIAISDIDSVTFTAPVIAETTPSLVPGEAIDLGLPSGIKWASCNVGASSPEEFGGYYAWGETEEKKDYSLGTYKWCNGSYDSMTKYCTDSDYGTVDGKTTLDPEDDVAHVKWGGNWRMPTNEEMGELIDNCTWKWTTFNGVNGYKVTGPNGYSIFLPAAGYRRGTGVNDSGSDGDYWSGSLGGYYCNVAYGLDFSSDNHGRSYYGRDLGLTVRPVSE